MTIYAVMQGMFVGSVSMLFELFYTGIIIQAAFGTLFITGGMLFIYSSRIIRPTPTFNKVIGSLVGSIMMLHFISIIFYFLTPFQIPLQLLWTDWHWHHSIHTLHRCTWFDLRLWIHRIWSKDECT